jgi:hypothetical protein
MEWIKVEDKLPIEETKVLLCFGEPFFGKIVHEIECGCYDEESKKFFFWLNDKEVKGYGVTHWMPLPKVPNN